MKKIPIRLVLIFVFFIDILLGVILVLSRPKEETVPVEREISEASIQRICELATLDCFYHNVTEWSESATFWGYGAKKLWIEYDGIVRVGIDGEQLNISSPDENGLVTVTIPDAIILDKDLDENSLYEIDSESPLWGFIPLYDHVNTEERKQAITDAQEDMVASAAKNGMILDEAKERAKRIIEKNILATGEATGKQYKVKFIDPADTLEETSAEEETEG